MSEVNEPIENYLTGYISIFRSIRKHWIWQDAEKLKWWLDLLLEVNHSDNEIVIGYEVVKCKRGETIRSLSGWAVRWGVSKDTVRNFLSLLVKHNMIQRVNLGKTTRITICNYESYQAKLHVKQTPSKHQANATYTQTKNDNNDKEIDIWDAPQKPKRKTKPFVAPTLLEFKQYFKDNGFSEVVGERAWKGYDVAEWHKSNGEPVVNWKQTCQQVWFRDENKTVQNPVETTIRSERV